MNNEHFKIGTSNKTSTPISRLYFSLILIDTLCIRLNGISGGGFITKGVFIKEQQIGNEK
jgi:hypothetical protein